jgi:hypothetical protein
MNRPLAYILATMLAGCAGGGLYVPPVEDDAATIDFQGEYSLLLVYRNGEDCSDGVGIPEKYAPWEPNHLPLPVKPDVETSFQVRQYGISSETGGFASVTCGGVFSFSPRRNTDYLFSFKKKQQGCSAFLFEKDREDSESTFTLSSIRKREEKFAMTTKGSVCVN